MKKLNLGCGNWFNPEWVNVDFIKTNEIVIEFNLLDGIPFNNNEFDVVYHSHLLEHFSKLEGTRFIQECFRVLKPGGVIRIAVPDLEEIILNYLRNLEDALKGNSISVYNYEWIMLELYDQTVRNSSGGDMAKYLYRDLIPNKEYVFSRIGNQGKDLHDNYLDSKISGDTIQSRTVLKSVKTRIRKLSKIPKSFLTNMLFRKEKEILKKEFEALEIGRFRLSGEIHQWMYDRYSLGKVLNDCGFKDVRKVSAFESNIKEWSKFKLDSNDGIVRKPDSLFMEAIK